MPRHKNIWVFGCHGGKYFIGNNLYFYLYLKSINHPSRRIVITHNKDTLHNLQSLGYEAYLAYSMQGLLLVAEASKCFVTNFVEDDINIFTISNKLKVYNLWHGVAIKKIRWGRPRWLRVMLAVVRWQIPKYRMFLSTYHQPVSHTPQIFNLRQNTIMPLGYPSDDIFFKPRFKDKSVLSLKLHNYSKIWLYAPTFRSATTSARAIKGKYLVKLNDYLHQKNQILLIKHHPVENNSLTPVALSNVIEVSEKLKDVQILLHWCDYLITDYSSVSIHFALTGRPMLFYVYDYEEYSQKTGLAVDFFKDLPGVFAKNEEILFKYMKTINKWSNTKTYQQKYKIFVKKYHEHTDGKSSQRILDYISND